MCDKIEIIIKPGKVPNRNYIVTTAIGEPYTSDFRHYSMSSWVDYCEKFGIGLAVVRKDLLDVGDEFYKKANWQKFLVGSEMQILDKGVDNICHLDTDIIISPMAPNIFEFHDSAKISVISLRKNLPFSYDMALKRLAFFRNKYYDSKYPLDSALFISIEDLYKHHNLEVPKIKDETCSGVYVFNAAKYSDSFKQLFYSHTKDVATITNGGDQTHFNHHVLNSEVTFLPYQFQAIWAFEQAMRYPFLYHDKDQSLIVQCIRASLLDNYFLHFAGSWHESNMWKIEGVLDSDNTKLMQDLSLYVEKTATGGPVGTIKP